MNRPAHIKVLRGIASAACLAGERHLLKPLETLFYIKSIWVDRPMPETNEARIELAEISKRCSRTIKRRIEHLIKLKFLRLEDSGLHAISWLELRERYNLDHTKFYHIPISQHVQLEYFVKATVLAEKKAHCKFGYKASLKRNPLRAEIIKQVCGSTQMESVAEHQRNYFLQEGAGHLEHEERFVLSMRYQQRTDTFLNGDTEINFKTGTKIFGYQSYGGYAQMKRALKKRGVIIVQPRRTDIERGRNTTTRARKVRLGFVKWNEEERKLQLIQPDKITVLPYKEVDGLYERIERTRKEKTNGLAA